MPTRYKGTAEQVLALDTFIKLVRGTSAAQSRVLPPLQQEFGLTESQFGALEAIYHLGPMQQSQLCEKILRKGSNVTTLVDGLEREKLVRRQRDEDDRRVQLVHLTERGRALVAQVLPAHVNRIATVLGTLTREEQRELGRLCRKLGKASEG